MAGWLAGRLVCRLVGGPATQGSTQCLGIEGREEVVTESRIEHAGERTYATTLSGGCLDANCVDSEWLGLALAYTSFSYSLNH